MRGNREITGGLFEDVTLKTETKDEKQLTRVEEEHSTKKKHLCKSPDAGMTNES